MMSGAICWAFMSAKVLAAPRPTRSRPGLPRAVVIEGAGAPPEPTAPLVPAPPEPTAPGMPAALPTPPLPAYDEPPAAPAPLCPDEPLVPPALAPVLPPPEGCDEHAATSP